MLAGQVREKRRRDILRLHQMSEFSCQAGRIPIEVEEAGPSSLDSFVNRCSKQLFKQIQLFST